MAQASVIPFDRGRPSEIGTPAPGAHVTAPARSAAAVGRRALDLVVGSLALLLLSPLLVALAALVGATPGPLVARRRCVGRGCAEFTLFSFRTTAHDPALSLRPRRGLRVVPRPGPTSLGVLLRKWGLERLPALANVVRGDLSLVGPAPLTAPELRGLPREEQRRRCATKPGWIEASPAPPTAVQDRPGPAVGF